MSYQSLYYTKTYNAPPPVRSTVSTSGYAACPLPSFPPSLIFVFVVVSSLVSLSSSLLSNCSYILSFYVKGLYRCLDQKTCPQFMFITHLTIFMNLIAVEIRRIVACRKIVINALVIYLSIKVLCRRVGSYDTA